jgi:hypothetical protein
MTKEEIETTLGSLTRVFEQGDSEPASKIIGIYEAAPAVLRKAESAPAESGENQNDAQQNLIEEIGRLNRQVEQLRRVQETAVDLTKDNTQAIIQNTSTRGGDGESTAKSVGRGLLSIFTSGFGLSPLIGGLVSLFGGKKESEPLPIVPAVRPESIRLQRAVTEMGLQPFDYGQSGQVRIIAPETTAPSIAPQITVQVQAMDSQSFLDHRTDIARAVREALLESLRLNDVIAEM